jgi:hypothetical protein
MNDGSIADDSPTAGVLRRSMDEMYGVLRWGVDGRSGKEKVGARECGQ